VFEQVVFDNDWKSGHVVERKMSGPRTYGVRVENFKRYLTA
jgi:hypothetical protein